MHPCCLGEVISDMSGSWCWAPASRHLEVTILHWCCHTRMTTARSIVHISRLSLYFLHTLDTLLWVTFNWSATSCCVWLAESKATIWTLSNGCMPLRGMFQQSRTQTEWSWCWYWTARGVRYVYMPGKRTQSMPVVNIVSNMGPDWIMNEVPRWIRPLIS